MTTDRDALREVVRSPGFRPLMAVRLSGQFSDGLFQASLFSAVFFNPERATSAGEAAAAFATLLLPYSLVGPFAGVFLDRWRRQRVLVIANALRALAVVVFASLLALRGPTDPLVVGLALVVISANRFILSGLSAALPHVVPTPRLVTANSVSTTLGAGAAAFGGASALGLRAIFGEDDLGAARVAVVAGFVYLCAGLLARRLGRDQLGPTHLTPLLSHLCRAARGPARRRSRGRRTYASTGRQVAPSPRSPRTGSSTGCRSSRRCCSTPNRARSAAASPGSAR